MSESNIKRITDVMTLCKGKVLLVRYKNTNKYDHQKGWFLPDELVLQNEKPDDTALRILKDQLGIREVTSPVLNHVEKFTGNDKTLHEVYHFLYDVTVIPDVNISEDVEEEGWFDIEALPDEKDIAHHGWAKYTIEQVLSGLENKEL